MASDSSENYAFTGDARKLKKIEMSYGFRRHNSLAAFDNNQEGNAYTRIRKEEQKMLERNIVEKVTENTKLSHKSI